MNARHRGSVVPSRRHFLKGLGVCVALPALESIMPATSAFAAESAASGGGAPGLATTASGAPLRTAFIYFPNGAIASFAYGNGITHTLTQNERQLPLRSTDAFGQSTYYLDDSYDYDQNGNVLAISDGLSGARGDRDMTYDNLDRLTSVKSPM